MKELINQIQSLQLAIENGNVDAKTMDDFVNSSKELYERAIILRYKLYEQEILSIPFSTEIPLMEINLSSDDFEMEQEEIPAAAAPMEETVEEPFTIEEETTVESFELESDEPVMELNFDSNEQEEIPATDHSIEEVIEQMTIASNQPIEDMPIENAFEMSTPNDDSLGSKLGLTKIDTLIGSFGLNERLQYINELFDGSSEVFSDAIKTLDNQADYAAARQIMKDFAMNYHWDKESETVVEFAQKVARRYA